MSIQFYNKTLSSTYMKSEIITNYLRCGKGAKTRFFPVK